MNEERKVTIFVNDISSRYGLTTQAVSSKIRRLGRNLEYQKAHGVFVGKRQGVWIIQSTQSALDKFFGDKTPKKPFNTSRIDIFQDSNAFIFEKGDEVFRISIPELKELYLKSVFHSEDFFKIVHKNRKALLYNYLKNNRNA